MNQYVTWDQAFDSEFHSVNHAEIREMCVNNFYSDVL